MKIRSSKKILIGAGGVFLLLLIVLSIHIYIVTHSGITDPRVSAMARIDLKQSITEEDATKVGGWLYGQAGIDHVLCNAKAGIIIFSFYPVKASANQIVSNFKSNFNYPEAVRYVPSEEELKLGNGCPIAKTSITYKIFSFLKNI